MMQTLPTVVDALSWLLLTAGSVFFVIGAVGLVRMPDVFTRMHAASVTETLGAGLLLAGMMLQAGPTLITAKLIVVLCLLFFTGPVATHALAQAALHAGVVPVLHPDSPIKPGAPDKSKKPAKKARARKKSAPKKPSAPKTKPKSTRRTGRSNS